MLKLNNVSNQGGFCWMWLFKQKRNACGSLESTKCVFFFAIFVSTWRSWKKQANLSQWLGMEGFVVNQEISLNDMRCKMSD